MASQGTVLVPFRQIFKSLGMEASWDEAKQQIVGAGNEHAMTMRVGDMNAEANGKSIKLAAKPVKSNGTIYVPLANVAQAAGYVYDWDDSNRIVNVLSSTYTMRKDERDREYSGYAERLIFADYAAENMIPVRVKGKWGYINILGEIVIKPQYTYASPYNGGLAVVQQNKRLIVIDKKGKQPFDLKNYSVFGYSNSVAVAKNLSSNRYGVIDGSGKFIFQADYQAISTFYNGVARAEKGGKWALINTKGQQLTKLEYDEIQYPEATPSVNLLAVRIGNLWGAIDYEGKLTIPVKYRNELKFSPDTHLSSFERKDNGVIYTGTIDAAGNEMRYKVNFGNRELNEDGIYLIEDRGNQPYFVNEKGENLFQLSLQDAKQFNGGMAPVKINNKWGYIGTDGSFFIEAQYDEASMFQNGFAVVKKSGKYGVIDSQNHVVIPLVYENITPLLDFKQWMYNLQTYTDGKFVKNNLFQVEQNGKWGLIDQHGKTVLPIQYKAEYSSSMINIEILNYYRDLDLELGYAGLSDSYTAYKMIDVRNGKVVFPNYNNVFYLGQGIFTGKSENMKDTGYVIMNAAGKVLFKAES